MNLQVSAWTLTVNGGLRYTAEVGDHVLTVYKRFGLNGKHVYHFRINGPRKNKPGSFLIWDSGVDLYYRGDINPHRVQEQAVAQLARLLEV